MAKDTFYFSHDFNARNDIKIKKLIAKHGYLGYGLFWAIVEELYNNTNVLPNDYECIAFDLRTDANVIKSIVNDFDLFEIDNESFGSLSIQRRLNERNEKSKKARESVLKRWNKAKEDTNVLQTQCDSNTIKERKGKEKKENIKEEKRVNKFTPPTILEVEVYFVENGYSKQSGAKAFNYYNVADWKDSNGKQVRNWKQKMQSVWFKDENKINVKPFFDSPA
jgi:hypothetical protein